jgi:divalent metal cation (Fe/Co/Zn/Cd) transporter
MNEMLATTRAAVVKRGQNLEYFSLAWHAVEGTVAIAAGVMASSISLMGFGIDSVIEMTSGATLLWRMAADKNAEARERYEKRALRIVGASFLALSLYLTAESLSDLVERHAPEHSLPGIILAAVSLGAMPLLARAKRTVGGQLASAAMDADARQNDFCAALSAILLVGLLLNAVLGLWWADPLAALVMVPIIAKVGLDAWRGTGRHECC